MTKKTVSETLHAKGIDIGIYTSDFKNEFISLTDIAKYRNEDDPRFVIQNWMRNRNTIEFLAVWEELHNPDFNRVQFEAVKAEAGLNRFVMTPAKWIAQMNAIGMVSKSGRYGGGTYAHSDIAMSFAAWISPEFQLYIMKDYQRLKEDENSRLSLNWNLNREVAKLNYRIHTDAIKANLIPPDLTPEQIKRYLTAVFSSRRITITRRVLPFLGSSENSLLPSMVSVTKKVLPYMGAHHLTVKCKKLLTVGCKKLITLQCKKVLDVCSNSRRQRFKRCPQCWQPA